MKTWISHSCSGQNAVNAQTLPAAQPAAPAAELVAGLPDFTRLVEQVGPAVVSVQAEIGSKLQARRAGKVRDVCRPNLQRLAKRRQVRLLQRNRM